MDLLLAAEQYAAAQATAVAAAQYYANAANAAMSAAAASGTTIGPGGVILAAPGGHIVAQASQPQLLTLPATHTWSNNPPMPPAPPAPHYNEHDDRVDKEYDRRKSKRSRSREKRKKSKRSRSRSRSRDRRRDRSRSRERDRDRGRDDHRERSRRDRDRSPRRERSPRKYRSDSPPSDEDWRSSPPNNTIMIRGLPLYVTEQHVQDNILSHGLEAKDIRLIRKKDTGASRGFAFVEFSTVGGAQSWIEAQQGWLSFDGSKVSMQYSVPRDQRAFEQPKVLNDWICAKCGVQNFRRREACFKCSGPRTDYDTSNEPTDEVSTHPTNSVLLSGLDALTTEDSVLNTLGPLTKLPLKSVRIGRDPLTNMSRGVCYVEMNSVVDSMFLHNQLIADPPYIDGKQVEVSYHKQAGPQVVCNTSQNQAAANSAMEAAQWTNKSNNPGKKFTEKEILKMAEYSADLYAKNSSERESYIEYYKKYYKDGGDTGAAVSAVFGDKKSSSKKASDLGSVTVAGVEYKKYKSPDVTSYQYDETSGYYYDPISTLYYDANSQYYFNSKTNKFCYWDAQHETFLPAPEGDEKNDDKKAVTKDKVKTAKRIQKDMEKWAKTLNQRKDQAKASTVVAPESSASSIQKGAEDIAFQILQRKEEKPDSGLPGLAGYGTDEEEEDSSTSLAEIKLTDWENLACLLCKRQFQSKEKLTKHNTLSDLHKQNILEWRKQNAGSGDLGSNRGQEGNSFQYRDRAKERRNKFGDDDKPVPNKFKEKYLKALDDVTVSGGSNDSGNVPKIGEDNVGNRMLQKMGWKDGLGLGKKNQGRTDIITAQSRTAQSGLGTAQIASNPNDTYKDLARKTLWNRYNSDSNTN